MWSILETRTLNGNFLEIIGRSLEERIIGFDFLMMSQQCTWRSYCNIVLRRQLRKARAAGTVTPVATTMQHGGDIDRPLCSSSSKKTIQACGESSLVQESDSCTYPSLLNRLWAPRPSDLGRKWCVHANPPNKLGRRNLIWPWSFKLSASFLYLCKWILVFG